MKQIRLLNSPYFALCDDKDFTLLSRFTWYLTKSGTNVYAKTFIDEQTVYMHQLVCPSNNLNLTPDHRNNNGLDNQSDNLRLATVNQQAANKRKMIGASSNYKGVSWNKERNKWSGNIRVNGILTCKFFRTEIMAAKWYNEMATKYFGEFAKLNTFPEGGAETHGTPN